MMSTLVISGAYLMKHSNGMYVLELVNRRNRQDTTFLTPHYLFRIRIHC